MSDLVECVECGRAISSYAKSCKCGWKSNGKDQPKEKMRVECAFEGCPLPGGISKEARGRKYFCQYHWKIEDPLLNQAVLEKIRQNYSKIMDARKQGFVLELYPDDRNVKRIDPLLSDLYRAVRLT